MKTEVKTVEQVKSELPYPKLMKCDDRGVLIVYFTKELEGKVVYDSKKEYSLFYSHDDWDMSNFKDLPSNQVVTLQND